jgi:gluconolactonase
MRSLLLTAALLSATFTSAAEVFTDGPAQKVGEGYKFTEGPAWHPQEKAFYFSDIPSNNMQRWTADGGSKLFLDRKSRSNGIVVDPQGRLIFCEIDKRAIVRRAQDGTETILADNVGGQKLNAPNDLWLAPNGDIYFTLPKLRPSKAKKDGVPEDVLNGTLCRISADGKSVTNVGKAVGVEAPNGVVGTSSGKQIWWTDGTVCKTAKINSDGTLSDPKVAAKVGSDGLAVDARGRLYTTAKEGLAIHDADANQIGLIPVPESPSNMKFGGVDGTTLFITARTGAYLVKSKTPGESFGK